MAVPVFTALAAAEQQLRTIEAAHAAASAELERAESAVRELLNARLRSWHGWAWAPADRTVHVWLCADVGGVGALLAAGAVRVILHDHSQAALAECTCREYARTA